MLANLADRRAERVLGKTPFEAKARVWRGEVTKVSVAKQVARRQSP